MSQQTNYGMLAPAFAGMRHGMAGNHRARTYVNDIGMGRQVDTFTITALDSHTYAFTVNGVSVSFVAGVGTTTQLIQAGLIAAYRAIQGLESVASANPSGTDKVVLTAKVPGVGFTSAEADAQLTLANTTANVASQPIPFGRAVVGNTGLAGDKSAKLPSATGGRFLGVVERIHSNVSPDGSISQDQVTPGSDMTVVHQGPIWVEVDQAVALTSNVFFRFATGGTGTGAVGTWRTDADTARGDQVTQARWLTHTDGAGLALLELNIP